MSEVGYFWHGAMSAVGFSYEDDGTHVIACVFETKEEAIDNNSIDTLHSHKVVTHVKFVDRDKVEEGSVESIILKLHAESRKQEDLRFYR